MNFLLTVILSILCFSFLLERLLDHLNSSRWQSSRPEFLSDFYSESEYQQAKAYDLERKRFSLFSDSFNLVVMVILLVSGAFGKLDQYLLETFQDPLIVTLLFFGIIALGADLLHLPFTLYNTFVIEARYGFNKITPGLFISDRIKGYILGGLIGGSLLALFALLYQLMGTDFWMYAWVTFSVVLVLLSMFYTSLILPLFNRLTPLPDGTLRTQIENYCKQISFRISDLMVMDGSKRSSKANAFFSGLGSRKKIVLFDTLISNHSHEELVAVLAHETGHYKLKHTRTSLVLSLLQTGLMFYLFSIFMTRPEASAALGGTSPTLELNLLAFMLVYGPVSMLAGLATSYLSRKHEYEADSFAAKTYNGAALISALKKLSTKNLSNPDPHPLNVFFYYSHPTVTQRISAIEKVNRID